MKSPTTQRALVVYTALAMVQRSMSLLLLPFVTRAMSPHEYGMVSIIVALGMFASVLMSAAVEQAVFRSAARAEIDPDQRSTLAAAAVWLAWIGPSICLAVAVAVLVTDLRIFQIPAACIAIGLLAIGIGMYPGAYVQTCLRAQQRLRGFVLLAGTSILIGVATKFGLVIVGGHGIWGWVLSDLCAASATLVVAVFLLKPEQWSLSRAGFLQLAAFAIPIVPHVMAFWALSSLSRPLMATVLPLSEVGEFAVAFNAANVGMLLAVEVNRAVAVDYAADSLPGPSRRLARIVRLQLAIAVVAPVLICGASRPFVAWVVPTSAYGSVVPLLAILSVAPYLWTVYVLAINFVTMTAGRPAWNWTASVSGATVMAVGTVLLGSTIGVEGVAVAQVACYGVMALVSHWLLRRMSLEVDWRRSGLTPAWLLVGLAAISIAAVPTFFDARDGVWFAAVATSIALAAGLLLAAVRESSYETSLDT
ncbi:lipopolysaccharide biosynthesis protein [Aeromicrobium sp. UC242_57]|uniref:lipopolysaccharide biosynthesis protein n=1 Tax=Aeromicrobium sp. UC242_57 TaxID=3374624 RepID=UPI00379C4D78